MALGKNIRLYRGRRGWTLAQLSDQSGVDIGTISALEVRASVRSKFASSIAKALGMSVEELEADAPEIGPAPSLSPCQAANPPATQHPAIAEIAAALASLDDAEIDVLQHRLLAVIAEWRYQRHKPPHKKEKA